MERNGGFQNKHLNWLTIGGPLLGVGGGGLIALYIAWLTLTNFKPSVLFAFSVATCLLGSIAGLYVTVAVFADWPLPEPGQTGTRRTWRFAALFVLAVASVALTVYLHELFIRNATIAETALVCVFVVAVLVIVISPLEPPSEKNAPPASVLEFENVELRKQVEILRSERDDRALADAIAPQDIMAEAVHEAQVSGLEYARDQLQRRLDNALKEIEALRGAGGWKDERIWKRVAPTMPPDAERRPPMNAAQVGPVFGFEVGVGNSQEIEFEIPLRINVKGVLQLGAGDEERYAADVYIDCPAARIVPGHETAEIGLNHFIIPRSDNGTIYGFAAGFVQFADLPTNRKMFRLFSVGVTHVNPTRGIVTFMVLCRAWYIEHN